MGEQPEFDVFLAHNNDDKEEVKKINHELKLRGLKTWLDEEQIPGGASFIEAINQEIARVKSGVIFFSSTGLGNTQKNEVNALTTISNDTGIPLIPVLLPELNTIPQELRLTLINDRNPVKFTRIYDFEALDKLEAAIKGSNKPEKFFHVWLYYDKKDAKEVRQIAENLKGKEINILFNENDSEFPAGSNERELMQHYIDKERIYSVAVFIGSQGSYWIKKNATLTGFMLFLSEVLHHPVIPVFLKNYQQEPEELIFRYIQKLKEVDFRESEPDPIVRLCEGIKYIKEK